MFQFQWTDELKTECEDMYWLMNLTYISSPNINLMNDYIPFEEGQQGRQEDGCDGFNSSRDGRL